MSHPRGGRPWLWAVIAGLLLATGASAAAPASRALEAAWVQQDAAGAEVRAVPADGLCPAAEVDGRSVALALRAAPGPAFPAICQLRLAAGVRSVVLDGASLPLPVAEPRRIVVFGDSGCRLKGAVDQNCNDPDAWPFAEVARRAAARKPDLVIHVGDYYYRETPCPTGDKGCAGSPYGDAWPTWKAEFFTPAAPLLKAAPWVMVRGNHESCSRGGMGWFRLLDANDRPKACPASSDPFSVDIGGLNLYVLDSADTEDLTAPAAAVADFARQLDSLAPALAKSPGWIVVHRPVWGLVPVARLGPLGPLDVAINATQQAAVKGRDLDAVRMVLSGHVHHFAAFDFGPSRPAQLIVGTGGDIGERADTPKIQVGRVQIDGLAAQRLTFDRFGYMVLDRIGTGGDADWSGRFYDYTDKPVATCRLHARALTCAPEAAEATSLPRAAG